MRALVNSLVAFYSHAVEARRVSRSSAFVVCKSESEGPPELEGPGSPYGSYLEGRRSLTSVVTDATTPELRVWPPAAPPPRAARADRVNSLAITHELNVTSLNLSSSVFDVKHLLARIGSKIDLNAVTSSDISCRHALHYAAARDSLLCITDWDLPPPLRPFASPRLPPPPPCGGPYSVRKTSVIFAVELCFYFMTGNSAPRGPEQDIKAAAGVDIKARPRPPLAHIDSEWLLNANSIIKTNMRANVYFCVAFRE
ncbi:hypothetical protein EVAR_59265_1 [Eumeta japonica]|uniref:Uncharacterized protein n=1 Tax=Eumeta variegata TaxID=151549 RepID=A0A4C1YNU7_EUMVA|nr:hypothetical protein EVAR_59265_1 [Eumeta japonica]